MAQARVRITVPPSEAEWRPPEALWRVYIQCRRISHGALPPLPVGIKRGCVEGEAAGCSDHLPVSPKPPGAGRRSFNDEFLIGKGRWLFCL